jgi:hypothetical protein
VAERVLDVAVIVVLFVAVGYGVLGEVGVDDLELVGLITLAGAALLGAAVVLVRRNEGLHAMLAPLLSSTLAMRRAHGPVLLAMTAFVWLVETFVWMSVGYAAGLEMDLMEGMYLVALASIFSMIPSGPAYAGTQDTAAVVGIKAIGGSGSLAVSYLLILRFVLQVPITLLGFVLLAARYGGISKLRPVRTVGGAEDPATPR